MSWVVFISLSLNVFFKRGMGDSLLILKSKPVVRDNFVLLHDLNRIEFGEQVTLPHLESLRRRRCRRETLSSEVVYVDLQASDSNQSLKRDNRRSQMIMLLLFVSHRIQHWTREIQCRSSLKSKITGLYIQV